MLPGYFQPVLAHHFSALDQKCHHRFIKLFQMQIFLYSKCLAIFPLAVIFHKLLCFQFRRCRRLVLCQEKVQIKCNHFSHSATKVNLLSLMHSLLYLVDIVSRTDLETNIRNGCECAQYCKKFLCIQRSIDKHAYNYIS